MAWPGLREALLPFGLVALLVLGAVAAYYLTRPTTLTLAVAPNGGTEPALLRAYADELSRRKKGIRLKVVAFDGVRESAEALATGKADLAVVRPDVALPGNGLTLAVLRALAAFVASPGASASRRCRTSQASGWAYLPAGRQTGCSCATSWPITGSNS